MNYYELETMFLYTQEDTEPPIDELVDNVDSHLIDLGAKGVHIVLDTASQTVTVAMSLSANPGESPETTLGKGMGSIRTAFHYCGANTPGWPSARELVLGLVHFESVPPSEPPPTRPVATGELAPA